MKILPEKYQLFERIKIAQLKTLPEKKWGFLRSFFDESRGYRVRKPGLGIKSLSLLVIIFKPFYILSFKVQSLLENEE